MKRDILTTPYRYGDTFTADALRLLREYFFTEFRGARPDVPDYAVIITDGVSNVRNFRTVPEAHKVQDEGIHIFSVGIGLTNLEEIYAVSSEPSSANTFLVQDFDQLPNVAPGLVSAICGGKCHAIVTKAGYYEGRMCTVCSFLVLHLYNQCK